MSDCENSSNQLWRPGTDIRDVEAELRRVKEEFARLREENDRLRQENARLRVKAKQSNRAEPPPIQLRLREVPNTEVISNRSPDAKKIVLFRRLFRGRDDVYAIRWERPDGRAGYFPASRSRAERERGILLPLTDEVIQKHLDGRLTVGVYPLLLEDTCWFLAADFDKEHWQEDVTAYLAACDELGVPEAVERSRSGHGAHVWIFFEAPVAAVQARRLGCALLTQALEQRHQLGLDSYDRLFPNQDTLPKGGFGNLIALPLQHGPRREGNSVFLDRNFTPYPDQWSFLSSIRRMSHEDVSRIAIAAMRAGKLIGVRASLSDADKEEDPWMLPPSGRRRVDRIVGSLPPKVQITLANMLYVSKQDLPQTMLSRLWRLAAFQNPEFYRTQAMRLSTFGKPRVISCAEEFERHIALPRGCLDEARELFAAHGVAVDIVDERYWGRHIKVTFHGRLEPQQEKTARTILKHDIGVLCAPTAFGKTVVAIWLIAARQVNTLVLVHRRHLLDQWRERLANFLDVPTTAIGQIGGGHNKPNAQIDIGLLQSLCHKDGAVDDIVAEYGQIIVDECHHIPAFTFERVLKAARGRFVLGLTATPIRKDGHHPIVVMQCGPLRFRVSAKDEVARRAFEQVVIPRSTGFHLPEDVELPIQRIYEALISAEERNDLICADLIDVLQQGRTPLLLRERREHLNKFVSRLEGRVQHMVVLRGGMGQKQRQALTERLHKIPPDQSCVILATGRYAGEGFDFPRLDTLLLAMPISWKGTLRQYAGRIQRDLPAKHEVRIYDYVDMDIPMLARMYQRRLKGYSAMGYAVGITHGGAESHIQQQSFTTC